jgi:mycothiol synthase
MMLKKRPYAGEQDWQAIADLAYSDPVFHHRIDLAWRLCSAALEDFRNAMRWEDEARKLQAFAALQFPWLTTDYAIRPEYRTRDVETEVILWSEARLRQVSEETKRHFPFNVSAFALERERITFLEERGYTRWENFIAVLSRSLVSRSEPVLPSGFIIRPFGGDAEVELYVALHRAAFGSTEMTTAWRRRLCSRPLYLG